MGSDRKLLGSLSFVSRTFEGGFRETPYVLDLDANLYIGPADQMARDEHAALEVVFHFLVECGKLKHPVRELLRNRQLLLSAFAEFDEARREGTKHEFRIILFGTYDGVGLLPDEDDELPAGPCGVSVNAIKRRFYAICKRLDKQFLERPLDKRQREAEASFLSA